MDFEPLYDEPEHEFAAVDPANGDDTESENESDALAENKVKTVRDFGRLLSILLTIAVRNLPRT